MLDAFKGWFITDGYMWDWLVAAIVIIINHTVPLTRIEPLERFYTPDDGTLKYPIQSNTVPTKALYLLTFAWPGTVFLMVSFLRRDAADAHHSLLSLAEGFSLVSGWKRWLNLVGRLRPNWFAVLAAASTAKEAQDGRESYPSGHVAYTFFGATVLTCWAMGKLHVLHHQSRGLFAKVIICLVPLMVSTFVMASRLADYKHDFSDCNAGCFIGISCGLLAYFINYPSLLSPYCHIPKLRNQASPVSTAPAPRTTSSVQDVCDTTARGVEARFRHGQPKAAQIGSTGYYYGAVTRSADEPHSAVAV